MKPRSNQSERVLDELLVLRAQAGGREAFGPLVKRWQERLWRHARRLTGNESAAWDVLQDSWIGIFKGLSKLNDPGAFGRWAYTIVTRAATARLRQLGPERDSSGQEFELSEMPDASAEGALGGDEREQAVAQLRSALGRLRGEERALLSLRYFEEFELWELAQILELPEGTVKSRLHYARKRLRDQLERMP